MGHSLQAVSVLVQAANSVFAVPLAIRIHEGLVWSNRNQRTLLDKMLTLLSIVDIREPFYFVADAYYASQKIINGLLEQDNHLVTRYGPMLWPIPPTITRGSRKEAGQGVMARKSSSGHYSAMRRLWNKPIAPFMAKTVSS